MSSILPTKLKTWNLVQNQVFATSGNGVEDIRHFTLLVLNQLIAWGWTVAGSGSANYGSGARDGVNRWRTTADIVAGAWICLANPAMGCELTIADYGNNVGRVYYRVSYTGFTDGTPSATVANTATDQFEAATNDQYGATYVNLGAGFSGVWHGWRATDNKVNRIVLYVNSIPIFHLHLEKTALAASSFASPICAVWGASNVNQMLASVWGVAATGYLAWLGAARRQLDMAQVYLGDAPVISLTAANSYSGAWPFSPLGFGSKVAGVFGLHGWFSDLYTASAALPEGAAFPAAGPREWVKCGSLVLPWSDAVMQIV